MLTAMWAFFISVGLGNPGNVLPHKIMLIKLNFKTSNYQADKGRHQIPTS